MTARLIVVTLGAGATQISSTSAPFNQMDVQNNSAATANFGDSTVSATVGIVLPAANAQLPHTIGPFSGQQGDAMQYYLYGTSGDKVTVLLT